MLRLIAISSALVALLAGGCGSTSSTTSAPASTTPAGSGAAVTRAQFAAQADAICTTLHTQQAQLKTRLTALEHAPSARQARKEGGAIARESVALARAAEAKLQALARPAADAATIERLLAGYREESADASRIAEAITSEYPRGEEAAARDLKRAVAVDRVAGRGPWHQRVRRVGMSAAAPGPTRGHSAPRGARRLTL